MLLHVLYPAATWSYPGNFTNVTLLCNNRKKALSNVVIRVTLDPFSIEEINGILPGDSFHTNLFPVTKINDCNNEPVYVSEYINDILYTCCGSSTSDDTNFWIDWDNSYFLNDTDNGKIYFK